ncbi:MAG TPA: DNA ligase D [Parafilimonas sp.]|nr:DNA ligase D [Parafilimonas sp.]
MLCTLVAKPFTAPGWIYEVKWDGYRIIAYKNGKNVTLRSRKGLDYTARYAVVSNAIKKITGDFVIDGEVVAFDEQGKVNFDLVQKANPDAPLAYYVFDILWKDGSSLMNRPLSERKTILEKALPKTGIIKYSASFTDGIALFEQAKKMELEGIIAKREDSVYVPDKRGGDWLKITTKRRQEFVIGGWAESSRGRSFKTLIFGAYDNGKLIWVGHGGGGFKEKEMPGILQELKKIEIKRSPFANEVEYDTPAHWVKPVKVAIFEYATLTASGKIRKPATFKGWRYDKDANDVLLEKPMSEEQEKQVVELKEPAKPKKKATSSQRRKETNVKRPKEATGESNWPKLEKIQITSKDQVKIDGCTLVLTNIERELWDGVYKSDLITYYNNIAEYILPHIKNRPLSLHIKPYSPTAAGLYIKDMEGRQPECAEIFSTHRKHPKPGKRNIIDYLVCNNRATLLYLINLGCIDINPWTSSVSDYLHPNFIVIDLDPSDEDFGKAITTAQAAKEFFDKQKLKAYIKTSGKTGMHIFLPCTGFDFPQARAAAIVICEGIHELVPGITTTAVSIDQRGKKLYVDPNQNDEADTVASAYSCRPFKIPTVSTPLEWKEVKSNLDPHHFTIKTIFKRLEKKRDLWKDIFDSKTAEANSRSLIKFTA